MHRVPVPRAFVLGRALFNEFTTAARRDPSRVLPKLSPSTLKDLADALRALGGSAAIRRSPLGGTRQSGEWQVITGGRPQNQAHPHPPHPAPGPQAGRPPLGRPAPHARPLLRPRPLPPPRSPRVPAP